MNIKNRAMKIYLKSIAPLEAYSFVDRCRLPSPERECVCAMIEGKNAFSGCDYIADRYNIHITYWQYVRKLKRGLEILQKSANYLSK